MREIECSLFPDQCIHHYFDFRTIDQVRYWSRLLKSGIYGEKYGKIKGGKGGKSKRGKKAQFGSVREFGPNTEDTSLDCAYTRVWERERERVKSGLGRRRSRKSADGVERRRKKF